MPETADNINEAIMNTVFLLMAEFESSTIPLSDIAERYLGMKPATADKKAGAGDLPIATFRIGDSQKAPRIVHVQDLADFIDRRRQEAQDEMERLKYKRRQAAQI
jgi:hypothetical protein